MSNYLSSQTLKALGQLLDDRHALSRLPKETYQHIYAQILAALGVTNQGWYLLGTEGCHLCHNIQAIIEHALAMTAVPIVFRVLDLADSQDEALIDALGVYIPILLTQDQMILYPFGLMDVMNLLKSSAIKPWIV